MLETIAVLVSAAAGFGLKALWEAYVDRTKEQELEVWKIQVAELEKRLSQFYWPIYLRLQRDNVVWRRILDRENHLDVDKQKVGYQIETDVLLPNHAEIVAIIEKNMHLARADKSFEEQLLAYLRHVDVYRASRAAGIRDKDPIYFGEPYPKAFFEAVRVQLEEHQRQYDEMLRRQGVA